MQTQTQFSIVTNKGASWHAKLTEKVIVKQVKPFATLYMYMKLYMQDKLGKSWVGGYHLGLRVCLISTNFVK